ncbi:MAG TPA: ATP-binding protein [Gemmataceae bacterium]|jgi:signal transduction histidine kinase|nr:ATP-binding protein [Gemmataceae bacterium]
MSYRAFKRLLGETSLERKCLCLFGIGTLVLISSIFWVAANLSEELAYRQTADTGRVLAMHLFVKHHEKILQNLAAEKDKKAGKPVQNPELLRQPLDDFWEENLPELLKEYKVRFIKPNPGIRNIPLENQPEDSFETHLLAEFLADPEKNEGSRQAPSASVFYYSAIRAANTCLKCHGPSTDSQRAEFNDRDLMEIVKISIPTKALQMGVHQIRAWLISMAIIAVILIMTGSYLIVRYIIVKPVKHLKEVSDAISAGRLNVRSEIQTGDEFEDLSHAFNRMLRSLVSMQDSLRRVNNDLDSKVDELAQANLALYESNRLKSDFLATMSHELRTPLNSILGFSEVLLSGQSLNEKQNRWVHNIQSSGEQLLNLINDILDLAKIEAGKMQVRIEDFSIRDVFEVMLTMFRQRAEKKNIELREQIIGEMPLLRQDPGKIQQILANLLSNAITFTPEGGRVLLTAEASAGQLTLIVADTGVGIAPEEQELVFEKFRQSGNPLTRSHAGTGLGLSIIRELSKLLGGGVTLRSELGRGSTFTLTLPIDLGQESQLEIHIVEKGIDLTKAKIVERGARGEPQPSGAEGEPPAAASA